MSKYAVIASVAMLAAGGCQSGKHLLPEPPGTINHIVFFELVEPDRGQELIDDCHRLLSVSECTSGYAGVHYDIGRTNILQDYDVGFFIAFSSEKQYEDYLVHPEHVALVNKWKPLSEAIRIYDVGNHYSVNPPLGCTKDFRLYR